MKKTKQQKRRTKQNKLRTSIFGTESKPRLSVYKSNKNFEAQLIDDDKRITIVSVSTKSLSLTNGSNIDAAAVAGKAMGEKIKALNINTLVFDRSGYIYHGRVKAFADAVRAEGIKF